MISYDKLRAKQAVQYLVDSSYFRHHVTKLRNTVEKPRAMPFRDDAEVLNELLVVGRQNMQAMENLIAVAEHKRGGKNDYQREYMAAKRKRDRKVLLLEELMSGKPVPAEFRAKVLAHQYKVWNKERDASVRADLSWAERNQSIKQFWDAKENELDELIEEARKNGPVKRGPKRVVVVKQQPKTPFAEKLANAMKK